MPDCKLQLDVNCRASKIPPEKEGSCASLCFILFMAEGSSLSSLYPAWSYEANPPSIQNDLKKGLLFVVSAPAGTGKTTLVQLLTRDFNCVIASISYTTRQPRPGEVNGIHYHFISKEEFLKKVKDGDFLEHVELYQDYYGTSRTWVEEQLNQGKHVVLVIDTQGAELLRGKIETVSIFVSPPSSKELERRLKGRQADSEESIERRLAWSIKEMAVRDRYDYLIVNDDLSEAYQVLRSILIAEEHRIR